MIDFPRHRGAGSSDFDWMQIKIAAPDEIRSWSYGEVTKPETTVL
jgi:DNA-directed RNA polymerase subunit beta'